MWSVWRARNDRQHGKIPINVRAAINWAIDVCINLIPVKENEEGVRRPTRVQRWQRPARNALKVNIDGAFTAEEGSGAAGAVARDSEGSLSFIGLGSRSRSRSTAGRCAPGSFGDNRLSGDGN
jgi:hypothetical protein